MDAVNWCDNTFKNDNLQSYLKERITSLIEGPLQDRSDYAKEKCIKSFCEGLGYLEGNLMYQRKIHPNKLDIMFWQGKEKEYMEKYSEVEKIIFASIDRKYRHFLVFL